MVMNKTNFNTITEYYLFQYYSEVVLILALEFGISQDIYV